jgi:hypothetical protein
MECSVCHKEFGNGEYCQHCGIDKFTGLANPHGYEIPSRKETAPSIPEEIVDEPSMSPEPLYVSNVVVEKTMICWACGEVIPADSKYCPLCSTELFVKCPKCGHEYSSQYPSCNQCGTNREEYFKEERKKQEERAKANAEEKDRRRREEERRAKEREKARKKREAWERSPEGQAELARLRKEEAERKEKLKREVEERKRREEKEKEALRLSKEASDIYTGLEEKYRYGKTGYGCLLRVLLIWWGPYFIVQIFLEMVSRFEIYETLTTKPYIIPIVLRSNDFVGKLLCVFFFICILIYIFILVRIILGFTNYPQSLARKKIRKMIKKDPESPLSHHLKKYA